MRSFGGFKTLWLQLNTTVYLSLQPWRSYKETNLNSHFGSTLGSHPSKSMSNPNSGHWWASFLLGSRGWHRNPSDCFGKAQHCHQLGCRSQGRIFHHLHSWFDGQSMEIQTRFLDCPRQGPKRTHYQNNVQSHGTIRRCHNSTWCHSNLAQLFGNIKLMMLIIFLFFLKTKVYLAQWKKSVRIGVWKCQSLPIKGP